jgi:UDP-glucose 4-epimerase
VKEVVDVIAEIKGIKITLIPAEKYMRKVDRPLLQSANRKMAAEYNWCPRRTLAEALKDAVEFDATIVAQENQPS